MRARFLPTGDNHRVTTVELLFDLVFVYAITAVSGTIAHRLTGRGLAEGLVIMALIWFGWSAYAWLGNQARADEGPLRISMYLAMAGFYVAALTIHEAFSDLPGGLPGPLVFVVAYAVIRLAHLVVYWIAAGDDTGLRHTILRTLRTTLVALALLFVGSFVGSGPRLWIWAAAVLVDYLGVFVAGDRGWRVPAPGHFAERHGLVVIIAIGESVVSVAIAVSQTAISWSLLLGALLGIALAIALWRTYFNAIAVAVERKLRELVGDARTEMARDTFTYLHLPAVVGIVGMAVGLRVMLDEVVLHGAWGSASIPGVAMASLFGGGALYLVTMALMRWRVQPGPSVPRLVVAAWLVVVGAVLWLLGSLPLVNVAVVTLTFVGLICFDAWRYGRVTREMRLG